LNRPVRIGVLDSGVQLAHPHVGGIAGGITVRPEGAVAGYEDRLGHGTAVAALIHHLNPDAELFAVKIFDAKLATSLPTVVRAIDWCLDHEMDVINLSLGTVNVDHRAMFELIVKRARRAGALIVSALEIDGAPALPGSLTGVIGVSETTIGSPLEYQMFERYGKPVYTAPAFAREIPGVPRDRNLKGVSFAVARISALVARARNGNRDDHSWFQEVLPSFANNTSVR
jgi:subtilisin family serine protease